MVRCHVTKNLEVFCVRCVFVQPDALAHSGAHSGAHSSSHSLTHTGTDGGAQHGHTKVVRFADVLCDITGVFALWHEGGHNAMTSSFARCSTAVPSTETPSTAVPSTTVPSTATPSTATPRSAILARPSRTRREVDLCMHAL